MAELQGVCEELEGTVVDSKGIKSNPSCPEKDGPQSEEEVEESSDEEEVEESSDEEPEEESSDEELVEPVLKYRRFAKEAVIAISQGPEGKNIICCVAVHQRFLALGMLDGTVKLLDHSGTFLKDCVYSLHSAQVNQVSLEEDANFLASCSDDATVSIVGITNKYTNTVSFDKPIKSVAIHPQFRSSNRVFVVGTDKVVMVEERRWPLGTKTVVLHGDGYGVISTIKWKENLVAWANEKRVMVYCTTRRELINSISFEEESPTPLPCKLYWKNAATLLVSRGPTVKVVGVLEGQKQLSKNRYMAVNAQNTFPKALVCGVVPLFKGDEWMLEKGEVPPPHLVVVPPGLYLPEQKCFEEPALKAFDKLLPKGYSYCRCDEYHIECVTGADRFYIVTPIDIILAEKRDPIDHIDWLMKRNDFEGAMQSAYNPDVSKVMPPGKLKEVEIEYIYHLIKTRNFGNAAKKCSEVLGAGDRKRWEDIIFSFIQSGQLKVMQPFIPLTEPQLCAAIYELVLYTFLKEDCEVLYKLIKAWPSSLYSAQAVLNAVQDKLKQVPVNNDLLKIKACLHEHLGQYDEVLKIYLHLNCREVFDLIKEKKLYSALVENLVSLLMLCTEDAVKVLVDFRAEVMPHIVVKELEGADSELYLHKYLDHLFERDPKCGGVYHERQVELYAKFDSDKLLPFLQSCSDIPLQNALAVCESYERYKEMAYLLTQQQEAVQHKPPATVESKAHTELIADLTQENARLKHQHHDHSLQIDYHQRSAQQLSQQLEESNRQLLQANHANTDLQQQLYEKKQHLEQAQASHQCSVQQLEHELLEAGSELEQLQRAQQEASAHELEPWKVARAKVELGDEIARGGWGSVSQGKVRVAVKQLHMAIASERNIQRLRREMRILSQIRHPNIVQFIGAVFDEHTERLRGPPLIITELLDTNLRSAYERNHLRGGQKLSIFKDVAKALKYLHERHDPIIHRDVSAPNVLLEALPGGNWKGKLTDLGSANFARVAQTLAEGAIIYAAPETFPTAVATPDAPPPPQTFKIDVYSFGVMLCEVTTSRFPDQDEYGDMITQVQRTCPPMYSLIQSCTKANQEQRPVMTDVLKLLDNIRKLP